jgi:hypothetical protein
MLVKCTDLVVECTTATRVHNGSSTSAPVGAPPARRQRELLNDLLPGLGEETLATGAEETCTDC